MRWRTLAKVCAALAALSATSAWGADSGNVRIVVDFNVETRSVNHWQGTGAIQDEGTIDHNRSSRFNGSSAHVTDSPEGAKGTFTWTINRSFTADPKLPGQLRSSGSWQMQSGTGAYQGITGQGTMTGTLNTITGQLHDEFVGTVKLP